MTKKFSMPEYFPQEQDLAKDVDRELMKARRHPDASRVSGDTMLAEMEGRPRKNAETFGIEPHIFNREVPAAIRSLSDALHRFEREGGTDEEIRELFAATYSEEKIETDLSEVKRIERAIEIDDTPEDKKNALNALVLEFIMKELANEWFPDCTIWKASDFDDIKRQTDLFMDVPGPEGGIYTLAIDVTYSAGKTFDKLSMSSREYRENRLHDVEYFYSDTDEERERGRTYMPRVITGANGDAVVPMAYLYNQWRRHVAVGSKITKEQALEQLRYHGVAEQVYISILRQLHSGYDQLRKNLKEVPTAFTARRETIKENAQYMDAIIRSLETRFKAWKTQRAKFIEKNQGLERELQAPENRVLDVILNNA